MKCRIFKGINPVLWRDRSLDKRPNKKIISKIHFFSTILHAQPDVGHLENEEKSSISFKETEPKRITCALRSALLQPHQYQ